MSFLRDPARKCGAFSPAQLVCASIRMDVQYHRLAGITAYHLAQLRTIDKSTSMCTRFGLANRLVSCAHAVASFSWTWRPLGGDRETRLDCGRQRTTNITAKWLAYVASRAFRRTKRFSLSNRSSRDTHDRRLCRLRPGPQPDLPSMPPHPCVPVPGRLL